LLIGRSSVTNRPPIGISMLPREQPGDAMCPAIRRLIAQGLHQTR
jgi:hypothetical protein